MYVCTYVCMYVCMCVYVRMYVGMYVCMHACMHVYVYLCMYICMYACTHTFMYTYINAFCMYLCMSVCVFTTSIYQCKYTYIYIYIQGCIHIFIYCFDYLLIYSYTLFIQREEIVMVFLSSSGIPFATTSRNAAYLDPLESCWCERRSSQQGVDSCSVSGPSLRVEVPPVVVDPRLEILDVDGNSEIVWHLHQLQVLSLQLVSLRCSNFCRRRHFGGKSTSWELPDNPSRKSCESLPEQMQR